jgi:hypothetical protein
MTANNTHEIFAVISSPQRKVHINLYTYIHIQTHKYIFLYTQTHRKRPADPSTTHGHLSAVLAKGLQLTSTSHSLHLPSHIGKYILISIYKYIQIHTHTYIYIHTRTHTETDQQVNLPRAAPCLLLRRNDCKYYARDIR